MALDTSISTLAKLTSDVAKAGAAAAARSSGKRGRGRYGRRPDFTAIAAPSSRPDSGAGVTFHFKHSFVSKKNSVSSGYRDLTSAAAHQRYIERAGAAELAPGPDGQMREISFGNLGATKEERAEFWRKVEQIEGKAGRVQCRMIVELPHELSPAGREKAARQFMQELVDRGFPCWAVIHAPDEHNDRRNYHLHAVYYDRPCSRLPDGRWDFELTTEVVWKNGQKAVKRPLKQAKDGEARGKTWIRHLRHDWAETANAALRAEGIAKRYDPRPYRESGVRKMPTAHLGNKIALAESQGIDTKLGTENSRREMRYRLSRPDAAFDRISSSLDKAISGIRLASQSAAAPGDPRLAMMASLACRRILSAGLKAAKAREANALAVDVIGARLARRAGFLDAEYDRLTIAPPKWLGEEDALVIAASLWDERRLIDDAEADIGPFRAGCREAAAAHEKETAKLDGERRSAVAAMLKALPALKQMLRPEEIDDLCLSLAATPSAEIIRLGDRRAARATPAQADEADLARRARDAAVREAVELEPGSTTPVGRDRTGAPEARGASLASPAKNDRPGESREDPGVQSPAREGGRKDAPARPDEADGREEGTLDIPGALLLTEPKDAAQLAKTLEALPGWQLRYHYLATRDAADFSEDERIVDGYVRALDIVEKEAAKRGLDLETGRMDPARAQDRKAFERHRGDWQPSPEDPVLVREID